MDLPRLHMACVQGPADIVRLLIKKGADVNARDPQGRTPLHYACRFGHAGTVLLLLEAGAAPAAEDTHGHTPLHLACYISPLDPAREEIIDLFRQYAPELVMEAYIMGVSKSLFSA